ncbi:hypothetical protein [uncultured Corynebacterium sp.]|uniref:hypothetical protein n=1 Tax=uncultured Corynebacterium sp. TaxID=159447 RepID=UPI0028064153|nr:hypothetical protein [uncultured Corynebacterium sp.]
MAMTRDTTWRYVLVVVAVALSLAAWLCTVFGVYSTVNVTFESYLTASVWVLLLVAAVLLYTSQYGLVPNCILLYPIFGASINLLLGSLTVRSQVPMFFDTVGTAIVAIIAGPVLGMAAGVTTTVLGGVYFAQDLAFAPVGIFIGAAIGILVRRGVFNKLSWIIFSGLGMGIGSGVMSVYVLIFSFSGRPRKGPQNLTKFYEMIFQDERLAIILQGLTSDILDKVFTVLIACLVLRFMPKAIARHYTVTFNREVMRKVLHAPDPHEGPDASAQSTKQSATA